MRSTILPAPRLAGAAGSAATSPAAGGSGGSSTPERTRFFAALVESEGRIGISHQARIGDDAGDPAVEAKHEVEQGGGSGS